MNFGKMFAITQLALCICASVGYFLAGDLKRGVYWLCAAGITASVTF